MKWSYEGEVGCTERMKIEFHPFDRWIYYQEERKYPSPSVDLSEPGLQRLSRWKQRKNSF